MSTSLAAELYSPSLELILLLIAVLIDVALAIAVYRNNPRSATNGIFVFLSCFTVLWLVNNYVMTHIVPLITNEHIALAAARFGIFWAAPMSLLFFLFAHTMPSERIRLRRSVLIGVVGLTAIMMAMNLSPFAFTAAVRSGDTFSLVPGPGLMPFSVISTLFSLLAVGYLIAKFRSARDELERKQVQLVLAGIFTMLGLIIATILVPIILFNSLVFLPFAPLYTLAFLGASAYAITKYQLFNIKVLVAQVLTALICVVLFAKLFGAESLNAALIDGLVLAFTLVFGYLLVQSVRREVEQRETIQAQEQALEVINAQQENLLHFISHEVKGFLTEGQNAFAGIVEGDFGATSSGVKDIAATALAKMRKGVATVMEILDASNLKKGTMSFAHEPFDFRASVEASVQELSGAAAGKNLSIHFEAEPGNYRTVGDEPKLKQHVIRNLIDNAIRYTPEGEIRITLAREQGSLRFSVQDSGVGITPEDRARLFTEGGHGKDSIKVNVHSTGYGLFIAKQVVDAHKGRIWADSAGAGKGSTFSVTLPIAA